MTSRFTGRAGHRRGRAATRGPGPVRSNAPGTASPHERACPRGCSARVTMGPPASTVFTHEAGVGGSLGASLSLAGWDRGPTRSVPRWGWRPDTQQSARRRRPEFACGARTAFSTIPRASDSHDPPRACSMPDAGRLSRASPGTQPPSVPSIGHGRSRPAAASVPSAPPAGARPGRAGARPATGSTPPAAARPARRSGPCVGSKRSACTRSRVSK